MGKYPSPHTGKFSEVKVKTEYQRETLEGWAALVYTQRQYHNTIPITCAIYSLNKTGYAVVKF